MNSARGQGWICFSVLHTDYRCESLFSLFRMLTSIKFLTKVTLVSYSASWCNKGVDFLVGLLEVNMNPC